MQLFGDTGDEFPCELAQPLKQYLRRLLAQFAGSESSTLKKCAQVSGRTATDT